MNIFTMYFLPLKKFIFSYEYVSHDRLSIIIKIS